MSESMIVHECRKRLVQFWEDMTPARLGDDKCLLVSQGRYEKYSKYYGCADLAHAGYDHLGLKHRHINRDDMATEHIDEWRNGLNVGLLSSWRMVATPIVESCWKRVDGGDVLIRFDKPDGSDAHVVCVGGNHGEVLDTFEYGQPRPEVGRRFTRVVHGHGGRKWQIWLPLPSVMQACGVDMGHEAR